MKKSDRALPSPDAKYTNLYIKNLDPDVTEECLKDKFSAFGKIVSLAISKDDSGASRGFGFVNFDNPDDARQAMEAMNGLLIGGSLFLITSICLSCNNCPNSQPIFIPCLILDRLKGSICS